MSDQFGVRLLQCTSLEMAHRYTCRAAEECLLLEEERKSRIDDGTDRFAKGQFSRLRKRAGQGKAYRRRTLIGPASISLDCSAAESRSEANAGSAAENPA